MRIMQLALLAALCLLVCSSSGVYAAAALPSALVRHAKDPKCVMKGHCGANDFGDDMPCVSHSAPTPIEDADAQQQLQSLCPEVWAEGQAANGTFCCSAEQVSGLAMQVELALVFIEGCPACSHNFRHFFCSFTCSPRQAEFVRVTASKPVAEPTTPPAPPPTPTAAPNATHSRDLHGNVGKKNKDGEQVLAVDFAVAEAFGEAFYASCKDVTYSTANARAMTYIGGDAKNYQEWFEFLGLRKDKRRPPAGSPIQIDFPDCDSGPAPAVGGGSNSSACDGFQPLNSTLPSCGDKAFLCSCGDCPAAPMCAPPEPPEPAEGPSCRLFAGALRVPSVTCLDLGTLAALAATLGIIVLWARHADAPVDHSSEGWCSAADPPGTASGPDDGDVAATAHKPAGGFEGKLGVLFGEIGRACVRRPWRTIAWAAGVALVLSCGLSQLRVEADPERLWVAKGSRAATDKARYEDAFGAFYRVEQMIVKVDEPGAGNGTAAAIGSEEAILAMFDVQDLVDGIEAPYKAEDGSDAVAVARLADICAKAFDDEPCVFQTVLQYWQMSRDAFVNGTGPYGERKPLRYCLDHWSSECFSDYGAPVDPAVVLGGYPRGAPPSAGLADNATAFVVTYPVSSDPALARAAEAWEAAFVHLLTEDTAVRDILAARGLTFSFSTQRSVQDELARETGEDAGTVALSYFAMLLYIAAALSKWPGGGVGLLQLTVHTKVGLGVGGVAIVAASVSSAVGLCSAAGIPATLISLEVIPFLALAVGVDNMFILADGAEAFGLEQRGRATGGQRAAAALASKGPSIALAAASELLAFATGALSATPAVRYFSIVAATTIATNFALQVTAFVALLAIDGTRTDSGLSECYMCDPSRADGLHRLSSHVSAPDGNAGGAELAPPDAETPLLPPSQAVEPRPTDSHSEAPHADAAPSDSSEHSFAAVARRGGPVSRYMRDIHAPLLCRRGPQAAVLAGFACAVALSIVSVQRAPIGLDQRLALPSDSYLQGYFGDIASVLRVGAPLFFVVTDLDVHRNATDINALCSTAGCDADSVLNQVAAASREPWKSYIATPAASWIDDYLSWISPSLPECCRHDDMGRYCPPDDQPPCGSPGAARRSLELLLGAPDLDGPECASCHTCFRSTGAAGPDLLVGDRPTLGQVQQSLPWFLQARPSARCAKGGQGVYSGALQRSDRGGIVGLGAGAIRASSFRTYHTPLSEQSDYIAALESAWSLSDAFSARLGREVYPYSLWHVFFEQYLGVRGQAFTMLTSAIAAVFVTCAVTTGSVWGATLALACISSTVLCLAGACAAWGLTLNAVALVNLAMAVGICVEFNSHVLLAFLHARGTRTARVQAALGETGASVVRGITLTKLVGVAVLATAPTQIFRVFYFRMYLVLVAAGAAHGLVLLPVLLALVGPRAAGNGQEEWGASRGWDAAPEGGGVSELMDRARRGAQAVRSVFVGAAGREGEVETEEDVRESA
ncbi:unnamed protein product [Pedinophyceae sp. YPF-701]|nr:unnamed protein product [Pedinophyceae sp. YPF-701]